MAFKTYRAATLLNHDGKALQQLKRVDIRLSAVMKSMRRNDHAVAVKTTPRCRHGAQSSTAPSFVGGHKLYACHIADQTAPRPAELFDSVLSLGRDSHAKSYGRISQPLLAGWQPHTPIIRAIDRGLEDGRSVESLDLDASDPATPVLRAIDYITSDDSVSIDNLDLNACAPEAWWISRGHSISGSTAVSWDGAPVLSVMV